MDGNDKNDPPFFDENSVSESSETLPIKNGEGFSGSRILTNLVGFLRGGGYSRIPFGKIGEPNREHQGRLGEGFQLPGYYPP